MQTASHVRMMGSLRSQSVSFLVPAACSLFHFLTIYIFLLSHHPSYPASPPPRTPRNHFFKSRPGISSICFCWPALAFQTSFRMYHISHQRDSVLHQTLNAMEVPSRLTPRSPVRSLRASIRRSFPVYHFFCLLLSCYSVYVRSSCTDPSSSQFFQSLQLCHTLASRRNFRSPQAGLLSPYIVPADRPSGCDYLSERHGALQWAA